MRHAAPSFLSRPLSPPPLGKYSVPVLWDKRTRAVVSNESSDIVRMLNTAFDAGGVARRPEVDLYPEALRAEIDAAHAWVYDDVNNGVYK